MPLPSLLKNIGLGRGNGSASSKNAATSAPAGAEPAEAPVVITDEPEDMDVDNDNEGDAAKKRKDRENAEAGPAKLGESKEDDDKGHKPEPHNTEDQDASTESKSPKKRASLSVTGVGQSVDDLSLSSPKQQARQSGNEPHADSSNTEHKPQLKIGSQPMSVNPHFSLTPATPVMPGNAASTDAQAIKGEKSDSKSSVEVSSVRPANTRMSSFPKRSMLQRMPSQAIADTPSTDGCFTPIDSPGAGSSRGSAPQGLLSIAARNAERQQAGSQDYNFPSMTGGVEGTIVEEPTSTLASPDESLLSTSPSSFSPESSRHPRSPRHTGSRQYSSSSQRSVSEYSTPQGFMKHRRNSSQQAPREVKETPNAGYQDLPDGKRKLNQYVLASDIGRGSFGTVQLAKDQNTGREYAVKEFSKMRLRKRKQSEMIRRQGRRASRRGAVPMRRPPGRNVSTEDQEETPNAVKDLDKDVSDLDLIRNEVAIMKKLDHPNVVRLYEVLDVQEDDSLFMVVELCANGPIMSVGMGERNEPLSEELARNYFRQIILAIEYLHYNGIIHRDIKPENILKMSDDNIVKLVDFGVSEIFEKSSGVDQPKELKTGGSPAFMSPELCIAHAGAVSGTKADIWALGVTLYCMVVGHLPFESSQMLDLYEQIKSDPVQIPKELDTDLKDLLAKLLEKDPASRIRMDDLREHPWLTCQGQDPLPTTEQNVTSLSEVTEEDLQDAIGVPSVSYIVNAVRAASRWKRFAARRTRSEGQDSNSSLGSASMDMSRSGSLDMAHAATGSTASDKRFSTDSGSSGGDPSAIVESIKASARQQRVSAPQPDLPHAASFPMSATKTEKNPAQGGSGVAFPGIDTLKTHHDHLSGGIDDCNVETLRYYEDKTGHMMPRNAVEDASKSSTSAIPD